jgi:hypothetical protein
MPPFSSLLIPAQGQIGNTEFKIDLRRGEGRKLNFSLISLKNGQTLEKVLLFWRSFSLRMG